MTGRQPIRLVLTGGETGGHLYPALAVSEALARLVPGSESIYVGAPGRVDMEKNIGAQITTHSLCISPYDRKNLFKNFVLPWQLLNSFVNALGILRSYRPHAVMGVGAFPSVPVILAARMANIPTLLLEPNAQPGMANRLLAKTVHRICVSKEGMGDFFPENKVVITGTPVRSRLLADGVNRQQGHALFGIRQGRRTVLAIGGSTGSAAINTMILENLDLFAGRVGHLIWLTGERDEPRIRSLLGSRMPENVTLLPYIDRMGLAYAAADLVVSSAGAVSLSELSLLGKPAVIIPDPTVTENHQRNNARDLYDENACVLVGADSPSRNAGLIIELLNNPPKLERLKINILKHAQPRAAHLIVEQILQLADFKKTQMSGGPGSGTP